MMQAADFGNRDDRAELRPRDWPAVGRVLVEREVSARPVIVREGAPQGTAQVPVAEDEDVIQTLASDLADEPLGERILAGGERRRQDFTDAHALHALAEGVAVE